MYPAANQLSDVYGMGSRCIIECFANILNCDKFYFWQFRKIKTWRIKVGLQLNSLFCDIDTVIFWDHCTTPPFSTNSAVNCIIFVNCDGNQVKQNIFSPWFIPQLLYPINCLKNAVCERNIDPCFKQDLLALSCNIFHR